MEKLSKILLFGCALALSLVSSCVSQTDELDLDKDINLDMRIAGNGISIPFGDLKKIYLDSLIDIDDEDPDALIKKIDGAQYGISMNDDIEKTTINIDAITLSIANPSIDPFVVDFGDPLPDNVAIPLKTESSTFKMASVDMSSINASLPIIDSKANNTPVTVNGLPSIIEVPFSKEVLVGGSTVTISKIFKVDAKKNGLKINPDGTFSDFDYEVEIDTMINGIVIPPIRETIKVKGSESAIKVPNTTLSVKIPTATTSCGFTYDSFPADVEEINYITFADPESSDPSKGQLINFNINLAEVDNMFYDPQYRIKSLKIEFPSSFVLDEDPDYPYNGRVIGGNVFEVTMGVGEKLPVQFLPDGHTPDPSKPTVIPVSFYLQRANLNQGPDVPNVKVMTFDGNVKYDVEFEIKGIPNLIGSKDIDMSMGLRQKINLADMSVDTKRKSVEFTSGIVESKISVSGLEDVHTVNTISFNPEKSKIFLSISKLDVEPFIIDTSTIQISFPNMYSFENSCKNANGVTMGTWDANTLTIKPEAIGETLQLSLSSLNINMDVNSMTYSLDIPNSINYSGGVQIAEKEGLKLKDLQSFGDKNCEISVWGDLSVASANVVTNVISTRLKDSTEISIDEKIDDALILVKDVDLKESANISFSIGFAGVPSSINSLEMRLFEVEFPDFIKLQYDGNDDDDDEISLVGNKLVIKNRIITKDELNSAFSISGLSIKGMSFKNPLRTIEKNGDRYLIIKNSKVRFSGDVRVNNAIISSSELNAIEISPTVHIGDMEIKSFIGKVFPEIDPIHESVSLDLDDDMDFLQNGANSLALSDPQISLKLTSTFSVPVNLNLSLSSKKKNGEFIGNNIRPDNGIITLPACPRDQENNTTTIVIYKNDRAIPVSNDSIFVQMSHLSDLMTTIPDSIIFNLEAKADTSMTDVAQFHYADITKELSVSGNYDVTIPLKFDSLYIEYNDTIDEMAKDLEDFADKVTNLHMKLVADVYSTVPLGIDVSAIPLDLSGEEITSGITISSCKIAAGTLDNAVMSELNLDVMVTDGKLNILDGMIIKAVCKADQTENGTALRSDEYLEIKNVRLQIVDGIDVDLTDKKK